MQFVTIEEVRAQLKIDSDSDSDATSVTDRAEAACVNFCDRAIYKTLSDYENALQALPDAAQGAYNSYQAALAAAELETDAIKKATMIEVATSAYRLSLNQQAQVKRGMVAKDDFKAAVLLMTGHLWRNREDVAAGQGANAAELPMNSKWYLAPYTYHGGN